MRYKSFLTVALLSFVILESSSEETVGTSIPFTDEDIDLVVSLHNQVRALNITPVASDMRELHWDEDLREFAQNWSGNCRYIAMDNTTTDLWPEVGQNYFVAAAEWSDKFHYSSVLKWLEQKDLFTYKDSSCTEFCGEFLQLAFSKAFKLGCAASFCSILETTTGDVYEDATLYMCAYFPKAPLETGHHPFEAGPACTNCSDPTDICTDFKLCTNPERQVTMAELKPKPEEKADEETAAKVNGWSTMQTIIAAATGGIGLLAGVGAILKLSKGSAVGPAASANQPAAEVPPAEAPADEEQAPPANEEQAPPPEEPEETITNGKAPTIPLEGPES